MNTFPNLSDAEIDIRGMWTIMPHRWPLPMFSVYAPAPEQEDHTVLFGIVTVIPLIFVGGLYLLNINLRRLAEDKKGLPPLPDIPLPEYPYIAVFLLARRLTGCGWYNCRIGRQQGYQPVQPIFFSHRIHAGLNQINCLLYQQQRLGQQACYRSIAQYLYELPCRHHHRSRRELTRPDGSRVNWNEEIKNWGSYTACDPDKGRYTQPGKPIEWVKVHNLPDLVYFNHSQHVRVGKVQCQTCHGPIQEMDEVRQFADLSMGWCINCHRTTKVDFPDSAGDKAAM